MSTSLGFTLLEEKDTKHEIGNGKKLNKIFNVNKTIKRQSGNRITPDMVQEINREMTGNIGSPVQSKQQTPPSSQDDEDDNRNVIEDRNTKQIPSVSDDVPIAVPNIYNDKSNYFDQYEENSPDNEFNKYMSSIASSSSNLQSTSSTNTVSMYPESPTLPASGLGSSINHVSELNIPSSEKELLNKLNYMIHMLEEQQDQRTNSVVEELILYCFLGVFIIFVIDSFAKVGKYTR